jgi:hypothetical protein
MPPEVAGCLSLVAAHARRRHYYPTSRYGDRKKKQKIAEKIDRLVAKAARYLTGRGITADQLVFT